MAERRVDRFFQKFLKEAYVVAEPNTFLDRLDQIVRDAEDGRSEDRSLKTVRRVSFENPARTDRPVVCSSECFQLNGKTEEYLNQHYDKVNVGTDGNCLFRTFAKYFDGDESKHTAYREKAVKAVLEDPFLRDFMHDDWDETMSEYGFWGDDLAIRGLSKALRVKVKVFRLNLEGRVLELVVGREHGKEIAIMNEGWSPGGEGFHFNLLVPRRR